MDSWITMSEICTSITAQLTDESEETRLLIRPGLTGLTGTMLMISVRKYNNCGEGQSA